MLPSQAPATLSPSISASQSSEPIWQCSDKNGWTDLYGENCTWYKAYDSIGCPMYGSTRGTNNTPAFEACCQ